MTLRFVVALVAVACLCSACVAVAAAQRPVTGAGGFSDAPILGKGSFADTLLARETLFYAVRLSEGQRPRIRVRVDVRGASRLQGDIPRVGRLVLDLYSPLRQLLAREVGSDSVDLDRPASTISGPRVLKRSVAERTAADAGDYHGPGIYYLAVVLSEAVYDSGATVELPLRLDVDTGASAATSRAGPATEDGGSYPGPLGEPVAEPRTPAPSPAEPRDGGGTDAGLLVGGGVGGLLAGALIGYLVMRAGGRRVGSAT